MKTIDGFFPFSSAGISRFDKRKAAVRCSVIMRSQSSSDVSWVGAVWVTSMPAEWTKMSSPPRPAMTSSAARSVCCRS